MTLQEIINLIESNPIFKNEVKRLQLGEYDYLQANEMQGVDYIVSFDLKDLHLPEDLDEDLIEEAMDSLCDDYCMHYDKTYKNLSTSSGEEIFIGTHEGNIFFPDNTKSVKKIDDFHAWLVIEEWMEEKGMFPGIFTQDYYGNVDEYKFDENYGKNFPDDSKTKLSLIRDYLELYRIKNALDEGYRYQLSDLPERCYNLLSSKMKELQYENGVGIIDVKSISVGNAEIEVEYETEDQMALEKVTLQFMPNSLRYIFEDGGTNDMSFLPVR
jgi:hypothetical protein